VTTYDFLTGIESKFIKYLRFIRIIIVLIIFFKKKIAKHSLVSLGRTTMMVAPLPNVTPPKLINW
jgi:hypothetical protein